MWVALAALIAALAADSEDKPRSTFGQPMERTIFDIVEHGKMGKTMMPIIRKLDQMMRDGRILEYNDTARELHRMGLGDPQSLQFAKTAALLNGLARAQEHKTIWVLDEEAHVALENTNPPWELVRDKLPRLPFPAMLVRLPKPISVITREIPFPVQVWDLLVLEEIPERKWRYLGFNNARSLEKVAYTQGWFDVGEASAKSQLIEGEGIPDDGDYRLTGEDLVWQLLINLMLALEHHHLDGQQVRPRVPRGAASRKLKKVKSVDPYIIVRLSQASRDAQAAQQRREQQTPAGRKPQKRHLRKGHWKTTWKVDPGDSPIYATKPRMNRQGELTDGYLYKVASWIFPYWAGVDDPEAPPSPTGRYRVKR
jgi:hypothetical protein